MSATMKNKTYCTVLHLQGKLCNIIFFSLLYFILFEACSNLSWEFEIECSVNLKLYFTLKSTQYFDA